MSTTDDHSMNREAIRRTLAQHAGPAPDASAVADAVLSTWQRMAAQLAPVIGVRGAEVLFRRALHLTGQAFPWLAADGAEDAKVELYTAVRDRMAGRELVATTTAGNALLTTFVSLLAGLIGDPLTERLLSPVWTASPPAAKKETTA